MRDSALFQEAKSIIESVRQPGTGLVSDGGEVHVSPDGERAVFTGVIVDALEGAPGTRICQVDLRSGHLQVLTFGPGTDRSARFSPDGWQIAFLSDRHRAGNFQLHLLDPASGVARATRRVQGWVESLQWSADGSRILLSVAGEAADVSGAQGAVAHRQEGEDRPSWMPQVETSANPAKWREVWVYEAASDAMRRISAPDLNIWEATWCGADAFAAIVSRDPGEGAWYRATLHLIDSQTGRSREIYTPQDQLGALSASPSGQQLAFVEAVCSDRGVVAGDLRILETTSAKVTRVDTAGIDISHTEWHLRDRLLLAGHRGFETATGIYDASSRTFREIWSSRDLTTGTTGSVYARVSGLPNAGDCVLVGEGFLRTPEIAVIRNGEYRSVRVLSRENAQRAEWLDSMAPVQWTAPDGLEIQGWLARPKGEGPHPLIMVVHGGPVFHYRPTWVDRGSPAARMLLKRGFALFMPNPRGSSGRGQAFARQVVGDIGGADAHDCLAGLDYLIACGIADSKRLGVMGLSYGGFLTSWLITQDSRFAAAVSASPHTNHVSQYLTSNIAHFLRSFLGDDYTDLHGKYLQRSPVMHAHKSRTPTLNVCGALDRCTPPGEAHQFHNALLNHGVESVLVTYPLEGHGIRTFPAILDYAARVVDWFECHFPPRCDSRT